MDCRLTFRTLSLCLYLLLVCVFSLQAKDQKRVVGKAVRILDGDTFELLTTTKQLIKIRLLDIDAPEKGQDYGQVSKKRLGELIFQKNVEVRYSQTDRNGRILGTIYVDNLQINLQMVKDGLAWHFLKYSHKKEFAEAEKKARSLRIGLWQGSSPVEPWVFRQNSRKKSHGG